MLRNRLDTRILEQMDQKIDTLREMIEERNRLDKIEKQERIDEAAKSIKRGIYDFSKFIVPRVVELECRC